MPNIVGLQVFYRDKSGELHKVEKPPSDQSTAAIKLDVSKMVQEVKDTGSAEYYYMVIKVKKSDGSFGYRTMIPKTMIL